MSYDEFAQAYWVGTPDEIAARLCPAIVAGIDYAIVYLSSVVYDHGPIQRFAREVIPQFA